jgi:iron(III) transport system substrate-binding protein
MKIPWIALFLLLIVGSVVTVQAQESPWIEGAKKERELLVYGTMNIPQMGKMLEEFQKKYPFIQARQYRAGGEKLAQRIVTEVRAGQHLADVYQVSGAETFGLARQGFFQKYESPERQRVDDNYKDRAGNWTGIYANIEVIGYNKDLVSESELPKNHQDLLDPKWKGKIGMDPTDIEWYITQIHILGKEKAANFMKQFAKQEIQIQRGHTLLAQMLAGGAYSLIMTLRDNTAYQLIKKGAPIDWTAIEPVIPNPANAVSLPNQPPHPNAAKLFIDYVLSREGQEVMRSLGRNTTRTDVDPVMPRIRKLKYGKIDWSVYMEDYKKYEAEYRELFLK